jgi:hypothetical protein
MQRFVPALLVASRVLAICAVLAGLIAGLLASTILVGFTCFDSCPSRADFLNRMPAEARLLIPCVVLAALALALFLAYCLDTRQQRRANVATLFFLVGGLSGVAALAALVKIAQATLPINEDNPQFAQAVVGWAQVWGVSLLLVAVVWSGVLAALQWRR